MRYSFLSILMISILVIFSTGCTIPIKYVQPKPNIDLAQGNYKLELDISKKIKSTFETKSKNGVKGASVEFFRESLKAGFESGLSEFFQGKSKRVLLLRMVELAFIPASMVTSVSGTDGNTYSSTSVGSIYVVIQYQARVFDGKTKKVIARISGRAQSKSSAVSNDDANEAVKTAIEVMYEQIAKKL